MDYKNGGFPPLKILKKENENTNNISKERGYIKDISINMLISNKTKKIIEFTKEENIEEIGEL